MTNLGRPRVTRAVAISLFAPSADTEVTSPRTFPEHQEDTRTIGRSPAREEESIGDILLLNHTISLQEGGRTERG
jgi:hypothetical protein